MGRKYFIILSLIWVVIITVLSLVSFNTSKIVTIQDTDKFVHFAFYFVLTLLVLKSVKDKLKCKYLIVITIIFIYGIIIEVLQERFTFTRKGDIYDIIANFTGIVFASMLNKFVMERISSRKI